MNQNKVCLAVSIGLDWAVTVFWSSSVEDDSGSRVLGEDKILAQGEPEAYSSDKELPAAIEESYKNAWSLLPEELRLQENVAGIVFSVPQHWFRNGELDEQKSVLLKETLSLFGGRLLGVIPEGELLLTLLKEQGNELINLVPISLGKESMCVFPFIRGKMLGVQVVKRSENIALDLEEALARFDFWQSFPPRILLLGSGDLEEARASLLSYPWAKSEKRAYFFHLPRVEIFSLQLLISGLIGQVKDLLTREEISSSSSVSSGQTQDDEQEKSDEVAPSQTLGFVKNQDIASFKTAEPDSLAEAWRDEDLALGREEEAKKTDRGRTAGWHGLMAAAKKIRINLGSRSQPRQERNPRSRKISRLTFLWLFIALALAGLFAGWWYLPKAEVVLVVAPKYFQDEVSLLMVLGADEVNVSEGLVPAHQITATEEDSSSIETTGEKMVGEKAKGKVVIYNRTEIEKTFEKGTVLASTQGDLKFLLDEEITIEPASIEVDEQYNQKTTPSKKEAAVVAEEIGADYNLSAGQEFLIASFIKDDFVAKNEAPFSGGSSHKAKVVAEEDRQKLKETVLESLTRKGKEKIAKQLSAGEKLIEESLDLEITEEKFSHEVGEETDQLSLTLVADLTGLAYWEEDLGRLMEEIVAKEIPQGFTIGEEKQVDFKFVEEQERGYLFDLSFNYSLYPDIDEDEVKRKIAGRKTSTVEDYLYLLPSVNDFRIKISPPLPDFLLTLPHQVDNITVKMEMGE